MTSLRSLFVAIAPTQQAPTFTAGELYYICVQCAENSKMSTTYANLINKSHSQLHVPILRLFFFFNKQQHQRKTTVRLQRLIKVINQSIRIIFLKYP